MLENFNKAFADFMSNRADDIVNKIFQNNLEYRASREKASEVLKKITNHLPDDYKSLTDEYEEYEGTGNVILIDATYEHGLIDMIALMKLLDSFTASQFYSKIKNYAQTYDKSDA